MEPPRKGLHGTEGHGTGMNWHLPQGLQTWGIFILADQTDDALAFES